MIGARSEGWRDRLLPVVALVWMGLLYLKTLGHQWMVEPKYYDFQHYYLYAKHMVAGHDVYRASPEVIEQWVTAFGLGESVASLLGQTSRLGASHHALSYLAVSPLTWWPFHTANAVWLALNHLVLALALAWVVSSWRDKIREGWMVPALVIAASSPLMFNTAMGQVNAWALLGHVGVVTALTARRTFAAGLWLVFLLMWKEAYILMVPFLFWKGWWKELGVAAVVYAGCSLLVELALGNGPMMGYASQVLLHVGATKVDYISLVTLLKEAGCTPQAATVGWEMMTGALIAGMGWRLGRRMPVGREGVWSAYWTWVLLAMFVSPLVEEHHFVVTLVPLVIAAWMADLRSWRMVAGLAISWWLLQFGYWTTFWNALLYGRMVGLACLMAVLLVVQAKAEPGQT